MPVKEGVRLMSAGQTTPQWGEHAPKPIASGSAFIGLVAARNTAVQMLWWRVSFGLTLHFAGLLGAGYQLGNNPSLLLLAFIWCASILGALSIRVWRMLINSAQVAIEHWTEELVQLEERNGFEGGCRIFPREQYPPRTSKPKVPKVLRSIRHWCTVAWCVVIATASVMLAVKVGAVPCSRYLLPHCS